MGATGPLKIVGNLVKCVPKVPAASGLVGGALAHIGSISGAGRKYSRLIPRVSALAMVDD